MFRVELEDIKLNETDLNYYKEEDRFWENGTLWGCICNVKTCIRKCCENGESLFGNLCFNANSSISVDHLKDLGYKLKNGDHMVYSDLHCDATRNFYKIFFDKFDFHPNGTIYISEIDTNYDVENYCMDKIKLINKRDERLGVFVCGQSDMSEQNSKLPGHCGNCFSMFLIYSN